MFSFSSSISFSISTRVLVSQFQIVLLSALSYTTLVVFKLLNIRNQLKLTDAIVPPRFLMRYIGTGDICSRTLLVVSSPSSGVNDFPGLRSGIFIK